MRLPYPLVTPTLLLAARQENPVGNTTLIPFVPAPIPQVWCTSPIYCPGPLLQAVQLSGIYPDSKTFVDKPLVKPEEDVVAAFTALGDGNGGNITYDELQTFLADNFGEEGDDLVEADLGDEFVPEPAFLSNVTNEVVMDWIRQVHGYWPILARTTATATISSDNSTNTTETDSVQKRMMAAPVAKIARRQDTNVTVQSNETDTGTTATTSFIPFREPRVFVIPGQRFREMYYWDSYFVILGLLHSQLPSVALAMLENFADLIEDFGFIPNGNRLYYLNRSQPPLFTQMVDVYINATGNTTVLERLLPLLEQEWEWWNTNRTIEVTSSYTNKTHNVTHYDVAISTAPRPESYLVDYQTVELAAAEQGLNYTDEEKARLYADIASAAESGHDFSLQRWSARPSFSGEIAANTSLEIDSPALRRRQDDNATDTTKVPAAASTAAALRYFNTAQQIPVELNAILYKNELTLARFRNMSLSEGSSDGTTNTSTTGSTMTVNASASELWTSRAAARREAILDLHWDNQLLTFSDYNLTSAVRSNRWSATNLWPFWAGLVPDEFTNSSQTLEERGALLQGAFAGVRYLIDRYNGSLSTTLVATNQQWDFPNVWAPHTQVAIEALRNLPQDLVQAGGAARPASNGSWELIPSASTVQDNSTDASNVTLNQLGFSTADQLPLQSLSTNMNVSSHADDALIGQTSTSSGVEYVGVAPSNIGNSTNDQELWTETLIRSLANRFTASALCSWYAVGGQLNLTSSESRTRWPGVENATSTGQMFEKYSQISLSESGSGGEYEPQVGFGWTNGVAIWIAAEFGDVITEPVCGT